MERTELKNLLEQYLESHQPNYGEEDANTIFSMLYNCYRECNMFETVEIRNKFKDLNKLLDMFSSTGKDSIFNTVCDICIAYESVAFVEGIKVGMLLIMELSM